MAIPLMTPRFKCRSGAVAAAVCLSAASLAQAQSGPTPIPDPDRVRIEALFKRWDADGNGRLSRDEVAMLPVIASKFTVLDTNKDGLLSPDEFAAGLNAPP